MSDPTLKIFLADDHEILRRGIRAVIETVPGWEVCGEAGDGETAVSECGRLRPDILLLDVSMPPTDGLDVARRIRDAGLDTKILVFTMHDAEELVRAFLNVGVRGYILKSEVGRYLMAAIESVAAGKTFFADKVTATIVSAFLHSEPQARQPEAPPSTGSAHQLSSREVEIAKLLAVGKSNKDIATSLAISVKTVETHRRSIMQKLEVSSLVELVHWAIASHLIEPISHG